MANMSDSAMDEHKSNLWRIRDFFLFKHAWLPHSSFWLKSEVRAIRNSKGDV